MSVYSSFLQNNRLAETFQTLFLKIFFSIFHGEIFSGGQWPWWAFPGTGISTPQQKQKEQWQITYANEKQKKNKSNSHPVPKPPYGAPGRQNHNKLQHRKTKKAEKIWKNEPVQKKRWNWVQPAWANHTTARKTINNNKLCSGDHHTRAKATSPVWKKNNNNNNQPHGVKSKKQLWLGRTTKNIIHVWWLPNGEGAAKTRKSNQPEHKKKKSKSKKLVRQRGESN